jgi:hypothetical protein
MWPVVIDARQRDVAPAQPRTAPPVPIRIGDTERDEAVSALGDHFAAGRLTREELDERIDQAVQAKFSTDLEPLFADLPKAVAEPLRSDPGAGRAQRPPSPLFLLFPLMMIGLVVTAIAVNAPWLVWGLVWFFVLSRFWGRRWAGHQHAAHRPGPPMRRF